MISRPHLIYKYQENVTEQLNHINKQLERKPFVEMKAYKNPLFFTKPVHSWVHRSGYQFRKYKDDVENMYILNPYFE